MSWHRVLGVEHKLVCSSIKLESIYPGSLIASIYYTTGGEEWSGGGTPSSTNRVANKSFRAIRDKHVLLWLYFGESLKIDC